MVKGRFLYGRWSIGLPAMYILFCNVSFIYNTVYSLKCGYIDKDFCNVESCFTGGGGGEMGKKQKIKKICFILFALTSICLLFKNRKIISIIVFRYYYAVNTSSGKVLFNSIMICLASLLGILVCWIVGKSKDKKLVNTRGPFSNRHPKLNMIIGLELVIIIVTVCILVLYYTFLYLGHGINSLVDWVTNMTSKMEAVVIVAFITGLVSIIGVIISSIVAKIIDYRKNRQDYLARKREVPYGEFVEMIYKVTGNIKNSGSYTEEMMLEDLSRFSRQITLWGSSKVVKKWVKFRENGAKPDAGTDNLFLMEEIMNEMRKDLGLKKVKKGNLLVFL